MQIIASHLLASAALFGNCLAHFNFEALVVNGQTTQPYEYVRRVTNSNSPVTSVDDPNLRCNVGGSNGTWSGTKTYSVNAGDSLGFTINPSIGHPGPVSVYLSKATGNVSAYDGSGDWFRIFEAGADANSQGLQWKDSGATVVNFTLPNDTPAGDYLVRGDAIALHGAEAVGGAQYYMGCAQISVASQSTSTVDPGYLTKIPGVYIDDEPGIVINLYYPIPTVYYMPGPAVWPDTSTSLVGNATVNKGLDGTFPNGVGTGNSSTSIPSSVASAAGSSTAAVSSVSLAPTSPLSSALAAVTSTPSSIISNSDSFPTLTAAGGTGVTPPAGGPAPTGTAPSGIASSFSSIISALPTSLLSAPAPTATATTSDGTAISTAGMTMAELLDLLEQVLEALFSGSQGVPARKGRRHARQF
ncbi:MAG: hypothetical protein Q9227_001180 [Pyrenula ochraceoflavens]